MRTKHPVSVVLTSAVVLGGTSMGQNNGAAPRLRASAFPSLSWTHFTTVLEHTCNTPFLSIALLDAG